MRLSLRLVREEDQDFLLGLYSASRAEELTHVSWNDAQKRSFMTQQFAAQQRYFREQYLGMEMYVVEDAKEPIGRFYVVRLAAEIRVLDLTIHPSQRRRGIGSWLITGLFPEADADGKPIRVHLEVYNRSRHLYEKHGFSLFEDRGAFLLLTRPPRSAAALAKAAAP
jgi:GNAT superfamily N-acetyltransferase